MASNNSFFNQVEDKLNLTDDKNGLCFRLSKIQKMA